MDELIRKLVERIEMTEEQARAAAATVIEYLQEHLPEAVARELADVVARSDGPDDGERARKATTAALAATTAAVNVVVLPGAR
jgi:phosphomannomutase